MVYQLEILNPEAQALLESLVRLRLIRLHQLDSSNDEFWKLLDRLRSQHAENDLSDLDILKEVESVRQSRHERAAQSHH